MRRFISGSGRRTAFRVHMLLVLVSGLWASVASAQNCFVNPRIKKITANVSPTIKSYLEFKPADYATNPTKKYALLVYIGGTGEMFQQPGGSDQDLCPVLGYSMPWRMNVGHFPDEVTDPNTGQKFSYLVVMPFVTQWDQQYNVNPGAMIDYALQAYPNRIDLNRIYLTGMSRGTDNIMGYVTSSSTNAGRIAAVVPVANCFPANVGTPFYNTQVSNLASGNVRVWGISCQGDKPCPETYMQSWVSSLNAAKPGFGLFTNATQDCEGPDSSFHYAWNHAYNPDYRAAPGNRNIYEWMIQFTRGGGGGNGENPPPPPTPNCSTIVITPGTGNIKLKGLIAPVVAVHIFNSSWATAYNQTFTNSPDSITVPSLPAGTYYVKVNFYTSNWSHICEKTQNATVTSGSGDGGGDDDPPPPPPTNCSGITMAPVTGGIKVSNLNSPVITVQIFNSSWATVYNQAFTNQPSTITASLPNGLYHAKVTYYTSSWSYVCDKMQDVTVGPATTAQQADRLITGSNATVNEQLGVTPESRVTVAPNPFRNAVWVTIGSNKNENASIIVSDMTGRVVMTRSINLQKGVNRLSLDELSRYPAGSYFLRVSTPDRVENVKLIKSN
ncbi:MAG TPA: T9SS type A sorting domain-containing protein [Chitinophagaceae bacterium]|nr:T9SS type A sorting domain-containing protein [Chitinophagaceae bacterium]